MTHSVVVDRQAADPSYPAARSVVVDTDGPDPNEPAAQAVVPHLQVAEPHRPTAELVVDDLIVGDAAKPVARHVVDEGQLPYGLGPVPCPVVGDLDVADLTQTAAGSVVAQFDLHVCHPSVRVG